MFHLESNSDSIELFDESLFEIEHETVRNPTRPILRNLSILKINQETVQQNKHKQSLDILRIFLIP